MDCEHAIRQVYSYLDGELTLWKRRAIARHLDECPPCADGFSFEVELRQVIVSKCYEEVPAELKERIARALGLA
jgi:mycothiol system anti-sigma-R factor